MRSIIIILVIEFCFSLFANTLYAQNIYELRKLTDDDWIGMSTEERLTALGISNSHARNQTFLGSFGRSYDLYPRWGYDYFEMEDRYENYAFRGFENYNIINDRRNRWYYNQFGDRLTKMTRNANIWTETFYDDGTSDAIRPSGYINAVPDTYVEGIWVASESTDDWAVSIVGADALRAKLTPLTLSIPNMSGMTIDFQSANYEARILNSLLAGEGADFFYNGGAGMRPNQTATLILRGGQLRRKFGALTLGATYVNMYSVQSSRDKGSSLKGVVGDFYPTPLRYLIRVLDDSPHDSGGPIIHDVKLKVNGVYRPDIVPQIILDDLTRERITAVTSKAQRYYLEPPALTCGESEEYEPLNVIERMPKFLDYMYMNDYINGWNTSNLTKHFDIEKGKEYYRIIDPGGKPFQVNRNEYAVYMFDLTSFTDIVKSVQAEVTVANDYRIQTAKIISPKPVGRQDKAGGAYNSYFNTTYWEMMAQAEGNIKDSSNLRTVTIDFGYEVANIIYGFDAHFNYLGFKIDGEFVMNSHHYMFADGYAGTGLPELTVSDITPREGKRYTQTDNAYYVVVQKDWEHFGFVGEYFKMGKFYRPYMDFFNFTSIAGDVSKTRNNTFRWTTIEDNDDDDQYPDGMPYHAGMGSYYLSLRDPDGVFPGNDLDRDSIPDNDKNFNSISDYNEPFLMLDVDPDEFVFGNDFNNNTIPDFREDDIKYDTPYDLDRRGHHLYLRYKPQRNINIILGTLQQRGVGLDNRTDDDYLKLKLNYDVGSVGNIYAEYRYERIQDNIQDRYIVVPPRPKEKTGAFAWGIFSRYWSNLYYDEIEYRNSKVNKLFLESRIRAIPSVILENHVKYERNYRIEGTMYDNMYQPEDIITTFAMSNKLVYTRQWGNFTFSPGIKFRLYKKGYAESLNPRIHYMMRIPILFLKYRVSSRTNVTLGFQGFEGFEFTYKDIVQSQNDYRQKNILLQIDNRTDYFGFDVWGGFGFMLEDFKFDEDYRGFENYKTSSLFVRMWLGFE